MHWRASSRVWHLHIISTPISQKTTSSRWYRAIPLKLPFSLATRLDTATPRSRLTATVETAALFKCASPEDRQHLACTMSFFNLECLSATSRSANGHLNLIEPNHSAWLRALTRSHSASSENSPGLFYEETLFFCRMLKGMKLSLYLAFKPSFYLNHPFVVAKMAR
jgi:hypothetical protein